VFWKELALFDLRTTGNTETRLVCTVMVCLSNCMHVICLYCGLLEHARKVDIGGVEEQSASVFSVEVR